MKFRFLDHRDGGGTGDGSAGAGDGGGAGSGSAGAGAGGGGAADGSAGAGAGGGGAADGSAGAGHGGGSDGGAAGAGNDLPNFQNLDDAMSAYTKLRKEKAERDAAYKKLEGDHKNLSKKVGEQGNVVKQFQEIEELLNGDPKKLLAELAKTSGVKIRFDDGSRPGTDDAPDFEKLKELFEEDPAKAQKELERYVARQQDAALNARVDQRLTPALEAMLEQTMAQKYPDWEEHKTARKLLNAQVSLGKMPHGELLHLALKGQQLGEAHKQGFTEGYEKAKADIAKKMAEDHGDGAGSGGDRGGKPKPAEGRVYLGNVLAGMHRQRPWTGVQS